MTAWCFPTVTDLQDLMQLTEGESHCLARSDELDPVDDRWFVVPVTRFGPLRFGEESLVLVETDRRRRQADSLCDFAYAHGGQITT